MIRNMQCPTGLWAIGVGLALVFCLGAPTWGVELAVDFDADGLAAVRVDGEDWLVEPAVTVTRVVSAATARETPLDASEAAYAGDGRAFTELDVAVRETAFDPETRTLRQDFNWGTLALTYRQDGSRLAIDMDLENRSDRVIELVELDLMTLRVSGESRVERVSSLMRFHSDTNIGGPCVRRVVHAGGQVVYVSTLPGQPVRQRLVAADDTVKLTFAAGDEQGGREVYHGAWNALPVPPGAHGVYGLSLRFAVSDADPYRLTEDIWQAYGEAFPPTFAWPDRRPIGEWHVADSRRDGRNPRGWLLLTGNRALPAAKDDGYSEAFQAGILEQTDRVIRVAHQVGLQGVIVWQIEGMQEPGHAYYGEPRILPYVAPEMDAVADAMFQRLRAAGLRVGMTLRPVIQIPFDPAEGSHRGEIAGVVGWAAMREPAVKADWSIQFRSVNWIKAMPAPLLDVYDAREAGCVLTRLDNKIRYAKQRWDATLFYLDANLYSRPRDLSSEDGGERRLLIGAEIRGELQKRHPDVMIIDEHQYPRYFAHGAQFSHPPGWERETGPDVRAAYPDATSLIKIPSRNELIGRLDDYVRAVEDGDMMLAFAWYPGHLEQIRTVYGQAMASAPFTVTLDSDGIRLGDDAIDSPADLTRRLASRIDADAALRDRRVMLRHAEAVEGHVLQSVLDAIVEAGGVIGWSQVQEAE